MSPRGRMGWLFPASWLGRLKGRQGKARGSAPWTPAGDKSPDPISCGVDERSDVRHLHAATTIADVAALFRPTAFRFAYKSLSQKPVTQARKIQLQRAAALRQTN